jgi:hypothetical protein
MAFFPATEPPDLAQDVGYVAGACSMKAKFGDVYSILADDLVAKGAPGKPAPFGGILHTDSIILFVVGSRGFVSRYHNMNSEQTSRLLVSRLLRHPTRRGRSGIHAGELGPDRLPSPSIVIAQSIDLEGRSSRRSSRRGDQRGSDEVPHLQRRHRSREGWWRESYGRA